MSVIEDHHREYKYLGITILSSWANGNNIVK